MLLAGYVAALVVVIPRHEPWFDEAQAWLLARDAGLGELLTEQLRYEGHPALWHLLLMGPAKAGLPYVSMQWVAAVAAVAGGYLLIRHAPFALPLRAMALFSFVVAYQYAVVARSYVLVAPLLFLAACAYPTRTERPYRVALPLVLLSHVSVHGLLIAVCVVGLHGWELLRRRTELDADTRRRNLGAGVLFGVSTLLVVLQLWPPPDLGVGSEVRLDPALWAYIVPAYANSALTGNPVLSLLAAAASAWWFRRTRTLALWLLPTVALGMLGAVKYFNLWHDGLVTLVWLFALWVSFQRAGPGREDLRWPRRAATAALAVVLVVHVGWWAQTYAYDLRHPYSGARDAAAYLDEHGLTAGSVWASGFHTTGLLPYFETNIFDNHRGGADAAYWHWSTTPTLLDSRSALRRAQPDVVVWGLKFRSQQVPPLPGYERVAAFPGGLYWKNRVMELDAFVILRRRGESPAQGRAEPSPQGPERAREPSRRGEPTLP